MDILHPRMFVDVIFVPCEFLPGAIEATPDQIIADGKPEWDGKNARPRPNATSRCERMRLTNDVRYSAASILSEHWLPRVSLVAKVRATIRCLHNHEIGSRGQWVCA